MSFDTRPIRPIRFKFAPRKALSAVHCMVREVPGIDLHTMLKTCYFADKMQLSQENQPIFGATYRAMRFGPVPLEIYEMARGEAIWLADLNLDRYPWHLDGFRLRLAGNDEPDRSVFNDHEVAALRDSLVLSRSLSFDGRTALTHGPDWQAANLGLMTYEDMLPDGPEKPATIKYLSESAPYMKL